MTDQQLLERYFTAQDQQAFSELVSRHMQMVYGVAHRQFAAEAEDITQAVFLLLSQKPRHAAKAHSVAAWLFWVTRNCCLNARRLRNRRDLHEREAGRMVQEMVDAEQREGMARQLDEAIAQLPERYQEAVLLRFLQGRSLEETGTVLGVSAAAAGKIANRALERLRIRFAKAGFHVPATAVGAVLAQEAGRAVPAGLLKSAMITGSGGGVIVSAKAGLLAQATGKLLAATAWKAAAAIAGAVMLAGATGLAIRHLGAAARADTLVSAADAPVDETKVDGEVCVVSANFLLDAQALDKLKSLTTTMHADSDFYEFREGDSETLRLALKDMEPNGQLVAINQVSEMNLGGRWGISLAGEGFANNLSLSAGVVRNDHAVSAGAIKRDASGPFGNSVQLQSDGHQATVNIELKDGTAILQNAPLDTNGQPFPQRAGKVPGTEQLEKPFHVKWDGTITPGRAIILIGDFGPWKDDHLISVHFMAAYKATATEMRFIRCLKGDQWLDLGPRGLRDAVDPAIVWAGSGGESAAAPAAASPWLKQLSDGTTVELMSISQERDLPLQRWTGDGQPLAVIDHTFAINSIPPFPGTRRPLGLAAMVRITPTRAVPSNGERGNIYADARHDVVLQELDHLSLWIGAGDWNVQPVEQQQPVTVGKTTISLDRIVTTPAQGRINLVARGELYPEMEIHLGVITKDHRQLMAGNFSGIWQSVWPINLGPGAGGLITVPQDQIDHYVVFSRPREQVVFDGFKVAPLTDIPEKVTPEQARAAETRIEQREWADEWADYQRYLARVKTLPRDATPAGAILTALDKVAAGDIEGIRAFVMGDDGQKTGYAHLALARAKAFHAIADKFGEQNVYRAALHFWNWGDNLRHTKPFLVADAWSIKDDTASTDDRRTLYLHDGRWCDRVFGKAGGADLEQGAQACGAFIKDLEAGKFKDAEDAVKALDKIDPRDDEFVTLP